MLAGVPDTLGSDAPRGDGQRSANLVVQRASAKPVLQTDAIDLRSLTLDSVAVPGTPGVPEAEVLRAVEQYRNDHPDKTAMSGADVVKVLIPWFEDAPDNWHETVTPQVLGILRDLVEDNRLKGRVDLGDAERTQVELA